MNEQLNKEYEIIKLSKQRDVITRQIYEYNRLIAELTEKSKELTEQIQERCEHEWVKELQMYQKDVYCKKCLLTDWEKCRF